VSSDAQPIGWSTDYVLFHRMKNGFGFEAVQKSPRLSRLIQKRPATAGRRALNVVA